MYFWFWCATWSPFILPKALNTLFENNNCFFHFQYQLLNRDIKNGKLTNWILLCNQISVKIFYPVHDTRFSHFGYHGKLQNYGISAKCYFTNHLFIIFPSIFFSYNYFSLAYSVLLSPILRFLWVLNKWLTCIQFLN